MWCVHGIRKHEVKGPETDVLLPAVASCRLFQTIHDAIPHMTLQHQQICLTIQRSGRSRVVASTEQSSLSPTQIALPLGPACAKQCVPNCFIPFT